MLKMARKKNRCTVIKYFFWQWFCQVPQNHNISLDYFIFKVTLAFWGQVNFDIKHFSYNNALKNSCKPSKVSEFLERKMIIVDFPNLQKILFLNIQHNCSLCKYVKMYNTLIMSSSIECHAVNYKSVNVDVEHAHSKCRDLISIPNLLWDHLWLPVCKKWIGAISTSMQVVHKLCTLSNYCNMQFVSFRMPTIFLS